MLILQNVKTDYQGLGDSQDHPALGMIELLL